MYIKSPFNWVGNKYKHLDKINEIVRGREYERVIEPFMGTGNILLNISTPAEFYIGNDNIPLVPKLYSFMRDNDFNYSFNDLEVIIESWNYFSDKDDYYVFRNYWNSKYSNNVYDKDFIYETALLLKMCSNSMVRFNRKREFNQGFRGLTKGKTKFFSDTMKINIIEQLNTLSNRLKQKNYEFFTEDFKRILNNTSKNDLIILDPPYILRTDMYDTNFSEHDDDFIFNFLANTSGTFIYFNYLQSGEYYNKKLLYFIRHYPPLYMDKISTKTLTGQGRQGTKEVVEIMLSNIKPKII